MQREGYTFETCRDGRAAERRIAEGALPALVVRT